MSSLILLVILFLSCGHIIADETQGEVTVITEEELPTTSSEEVGQVAPDLGSSPDPSNDTISVQSVSSSPSFLPINCESRNLSSSEEPKVRLVNSSEIVQILDSSSLTVTGSEGLEEQNQSSKVCLIIMFYYPWCIFSSKAAPSFNALGRIYPQFHVLASDAYSNNGINMRFGLVGVPSILLLQSSKLIAKYNDSDPSIEGLVSFVTKMTGVNPVGEPSITEQDLEGPVPTKPEPRIDSILIISWIFVLACLSFFFYKSTTFKKFLEFVARNWREAEAEQHLHME